MPDEPLWLAGLRRGEGAGWLFREDQLPGSRDPQPVFLISMHDDQLAMALEELVAADGAAAGASRRLLRPRGRC